jgi:hypothetical protein
LSPARRAAIAGAAAVVLMLAIQVVGAGLVTTTAPLGLVSLQFAPDPAEATAIVVSWAGAARTAALRAHALDLLLPIAYATAISSAGTALAFGRAAGSPAAATARRAGRAGVAAAVLDQVENAAMAVTLLASPSVAAGGVTLVAALGKWTLLTVALPGLGWVRWRTRA